MAARCAAALPLHAPAWHSPTLSAEKQLSRGAPGCPNVRPARAALAAPRRPPRRQTAAYVVGQLLSPGGPAFDYLPFFYSRVFNLSWQVRRAGGGMCGKAAPCAPAP